MSWFGTANEGEILFSSPDTSGLYDFSGLTGDVTGLIGTTVVDALKGVPISTGVPLVDQVLKFNGSEWSFQPDASGTQEVHSLLGVYHGDTVPHAAVRGDIIVAQGTGVALWDALSIGTQGFVLYSDGTDALYTRLGQNTPFELGTTGAPSVTFVGDLDTGWSAASGDIMIGSAGGVGLISLDGIDQQIELTAGQVWKTRSGGTTTLTKADYTYLATSVPATVTLPASPDEGEVHIIKDRDGLATGANPVTIDGNGNNIDGNASIFLKQKYGSFTLIYSGTKWNII